MNPNNIESSQLQNIPLVKVDLSKHTWIKPENIVRTETIIQNNTEYEYLVLDTSTMQGPPKLYAICNGGLIAISNQYPERYRKAALKHEISEKIENINRKHDETICLECLKKELEEIQADPNIDYKDYINNRHTFFESVATYYANNPNRTLEDEIVFKQVTKSYEYITELKNTLEE